MAFIQLGNDSQLKFKIPTKNTTNWSDQLKTDFFQKLVEHDHSGNGKGVQIDGAGIADDSITQLKIRLDNSEFLRGRNQGDTADISIIGINNSDKISFGTTIEGITADGAVITNIESDSVSTDKIVATKTQTIESAAITAIESTLDATKNHRLEYRIQYNSLSQVGTLDISTDSFTETCLGTDHGFEFTVDFTGPISVSLDTTSEPTIDNLNNVIITYIIKEI